MANIALRNIGQLLLMSGDMATFGQRREELLGLISDAALVVEEGKVAWYGIEKEFPSRYGKLEQLDCKGCVLTPGLIDSHTHLVHAGSRELEYELRCSGVAYADIAARGGGIKFTVAQTRKASFEELYASTKARALRMLNLGVTTIEIKSGYGLDLETELKQLEVVKKLRTEFPGTLFATYLGAHEVPADKNREQYISLMLNEVIPKVAKSGLADFCDIFCEKNVYSVEESRKILNCAKEHGLKIKLHAEELNTLGGAELAAELGAVSADHLMCISDQGIAKMVERKVTFNLLPATTLFLGKKQYAPARKIIEAGGRIALSTDCNPGSSPCENLAFITTLACSQMGLSPAEALWAITRGAAFALGAEEELGQIKLHGRADLVLFQVQNYQAIPYAFGRNIVNKTFVAGAII